MTTVARAAVVVAVVTALGTSACTADVKTVERDERPTTTASTVYLPERLTDLVPVARGVLAKGKPERMEDYDVMLRTCIQLQRSAKAATDAGAGSAERGGLDDRQVGAAVRAGELCATDPKAAAAALP